MRPDLIFLMTAQRLKIWCPVNETICSPRTHFCCMKHAPPCGNSMNWPQSTSTVRVKGCLSCNAHFCKFMTYYSSVLQITIICEYKLNPLQNKRTPVNRQNSENPPGQCEIMEMCCRNTEDNSAESVLWLVRNKVRCVPFARNCCKLTSMKTFSLSLTSLHLCDSFCGSLSEKQDISCTYCTLSI